MGNVLVFCCLKMHAHKYDKVIVNQHSIWNQQISIAFITMLIENEGDCNNASFDLVCIGCQSLLLHSTPHYGPSNDARLWEILILSIMMIGLLTHKAFPYPPLT